MGNCEYKIQDLSKAFKFFSLAAEQGWVDGQLQLGIMYYSTLTTLIIIIIVIITTSTATYFVFLYIV